MRNTIILGLLIVWGSTLKAQSANEELQWEEVYKEANTSVQTCFPKQVIADGSKEVVFNWKLSSVQRASFEKCIKVIKNIALHKDLYDCETSELVAKTDSTRLAYYFFNSPWPVPDVDLVRSISSSLDEKNQVFVSQHISTPKAVKDKGFKRLQVSDIVYRLEKLSDSETRFEIQGKFIPVGVPLVLAKAWFPNGPVKILDKIVELTKK